MTDSFSALELRKAVSMLASPSLIRLITEIDDNGPIPPSGLARTLADLPAQQLRQTTDLARSRGLLHAPPGAGLCLTAAGSELADIYDTTARWARTHAYPSRVSDYLTRVQRTLRLLSEPGAALALADGPARPTDSRAFGLQDDVHPARSRELLHRWLHAYPQAARRAGVEPAA